MDDYIVKATAAAGQIRLYAATTKHLVEEARQRHQTTPPATAALGRLLTAAAMMGGMLKMEQETITLKIDGDGPIGGLIAVADAYGNLKGYPCQPTVMLPPNDRGKLDVASAVGNGVLSVTRDLGLKEPVTGTAALVTGEIGDDLTYYFTISEQTPSSVGLGVLVDRDGTVLAAGGFIVQAMPGCGDAITARLAQTIKELPSPTEMLRQGLTPEDICRRLAGDLDWQLLEKRAARFHCGCSRDSLARAIASLDRGDLQEYIDDGQPLEGICDYCHTSYWFEPTALDAMFK